MNSNKTYHKLSVYQKFNSSIFWQNKIQQIQQDSSIAKQQTKTIKCMANKMSNFSWNGLDCMYSYFETAYYLLRN